MKKVFEESFSTFGMISKPILSTMIWDPHNTVIFTDSLKKSDLKFVPDQEKLHEVIMCTEITGCTDRGSSFHLRKDI